MNNVLTIKSCEVKESLIRFDFSDILFKEFQEKYGEIDNANSFLYFVRRFGFSSPKDTYKQLASYLLECEEYPDIYVGASITTGIYISFYTPKKKYQYFQDKYFVNAKVEYYKQFYSYLMETNQKMKDFEEDILVFIKKSVKAINQNMPESEKETKDYLLESFSRINNWEDFIYEIPNFMEGFASLEYRHAEAFKLFHNWLNPREFEFQKVKNIKKPSFHDIEENEEMNELKNKCLKILENFLIPTYIRDVNYNIYGRFGDDIEQTGLIEYFEAEVN